MDDLGTESWGGHMPNTIANLPQGCIAWVSGYPVVSTTSEDQIMFTECDVVKGRWYDISLINITPDQGNTKATEFRLRYTTDASMYPNNSSPIFAISLRVSQFEMSNIRAMWGANYTGRLRLRASIGSLDGQNVRCWAPGSGCLLQVYDMGVTPASRGAVGNVPYGKTLKEWTVSIDQSHIYYGDRSSYVGNYTQWLQQGYFDHHGLRRTWMTFSAADRATIADVIGVPYTDIITAELYVNVANWANPGGGWPLVGYHNQTVLTSTEPNGGLPNKQEYFMGSTGAAWLDLKANGSASGSIVESMQSGYFKGFMVGPAIGSGLEDPRYQMIAHGTEPGGDRPKLHMKYYK